MNPRLTRSRLREGLLGSGRPVSSIEAVLNIEVGGHRVADDILLGIGGFSDSNPNSLQDAALKNDIEELHRAGEDRRRRRLEERRRKRANGAANPAPRPQPPRSPQSPQLPDRRHPRAAKQ
ncbi:hypothetical protein QQZ08_012138 [Neonectria magnoliae]|uniref:Uncharacterized protein n=1 Tax=Neonectria magnoliae TaxID=2732573 RepID=A0ABR1H608_9HYPO